MTSSPSEAAGIDRKLSFTGASRSNSGANHGLGLAIVKAIALMHGGTVFVRSEQGMNTFGINLPS